MITSFAAFLAHYFFLATARTVLALIIATAAAVFFSSFYSTFLAFSLTSNFLAATANLAFFSFFTSLSLTFFSIFVSLVLDTLTTFTTYILEWSIAPATFLSPLQGFLSVLTCALTTFFVVGAITFKIFFTFLTLGFMASSSAFLASAFALAILAI